MEKFKKLINRDFKKAAILTAENPNGKKASKLFNLRANHTLKQRLDSFGHSYIKIEGVYNNNHETSFLVFDISKTSAKFMAFAKGGLKQECFIFINDTRFDLVFSNNETITTSDDICIDSHTDNYTIINGIKFNINF